MSLIVVDVPSQFPVIDEVVAKLDIAQEKVMIEVEMLDVSKTHLDKIGFDWQNGLTGTFKAGALTTDFPLGRSYLTHRFNLGHGETYTKQDAGTGDSASAPPVLGVIDLTGLSLVIV